MSELEIALERIEQLEKENEELRGNKKTLQLTCKVHREKDAKQKEIIAEKEKEVVELKEIALKRALIIERDTRRELDTDENIYEQQQALTLCVDALKSVKSDMGHDNKKCKCGHCTQIRETIWIGDKILNPAILPVPSGQDGREKGKT